MLVDVSRLVSAYYAEQPDASIPAQRVAFGTSGHRGSAFERSFNENHILAITQAICEFRKAQGIDGPLFLGKDTHALSEPAFETAIEVLAANQADVIVAAEPGYTPTPVISHAILTYNRNRKTGRADGIVITPSHNPPDDGGFKYNPPHGGPAETRITAAIEAIANDILANRLKDVRRIPFDRALRAGTTHKQDLVNPYVADLENVIDMECIRAAGLRIGVDPLGGAGVPYWPAIAERHRLNLTVVNDAIDPTFRFMTVDWDGRIRMDPSSPYAMRGLIGLKDRFDIAVACDTDHDRHGIVTRSAGLLPPNHYLAVCAGYLLENRRNWPRDAGIGKTIVSSSAIDRVTEKLGHRLYEVPVGFKWFVEGLLNGRLGFAGEESAGASFLRLNGGAWSTDKDGITAALLAAEITSRTGRDPGENYRRLTGEFGEFFYRRIDAPATTEQKQALAQMSPEHIRSRALAGEEIRQILTKAPGDGSPIGGVKVVAPGGWFAARPSGTEEIYKIYAESFRSEEHLEQIIEDAQAIVGQAFETRRSGAA
jgi:phosphoglucomutase